MNHKNIAQGVFATSTIGIEVSDSAGRMMECNPAFCKFVNYDAAELATLTVLIYATTTIENGSNPNVVN